MDQLLARSCCQVRPELKKTFAGFHLPSNTIRILKLLDMVSMTSLLAGFPPT